MIKRIVCVLCAGLLLLFTCGCGLSASNENTPEDPVWEAEAPELPDLARLLTVEDVRTATGIHVQDGVLQENGTVLLFVTDNYATQVSFLLEKPTIDATEYLNAIAAQYAEGSVEIVQNLGDRAYWCAESGELLVSEKDCIFSVNIQSNVLNSDACLIAARQMSMKVLGRL